MPSKALVWFKRDLRMRDHAPLAMAASCDAAVGVFVIEHEWLQSPEFDPQHLAMTNAASSFHGIHARRTDDNFR